MEFAAAMQDLLATSGSPKAIRVVRCLSLDVTTSGQERNFNLTKEEMSLFVNTMYFEGDRGRSIVSKIEKEVEAAYALERKTPKAREDRLAFEKHEEALFKEAHERFLKEGEKKSKIDPAKTSKKYLADAKTEKNKGLMTCSIVETLYTQQGARGLIYEPFCVTFETLPGRLQTFWCGIVTKVSTYAPSHISHTLSMPSQYTLSTCPLAPLLSIVGCDDMAPCNPVMIIVVAIEERGHHFERRHPAIREQRDGDGGQEPGDQQTLIHPHDTTTFHSHMHLTTSHSHMHLPHMHLSHISPACWAARRGTARSTTMR